jgi:hypothetical protein
VRQTLGHEFARALVSKFSQSFYKRFGDKGLAPRLTSECLLVQDTTNYALGPHTDSPRKVITCLFYLPERASRSHLGTSLYVPTVRSFTCKGGPHYPREAFDKVASMPYIPNALFAFVKTNKSFHGVERIDCGDYRRWLLLYDIYEEGK